MKKKLLFGGIVSIAVIIPLYIATVVAYNFNRPAQTAKPAVASQEVTSKPVKPETPPTVEELLRLVNNERKKAGVAPLVLDGRMMKTAQLKAEHMHENKYFQHDIPGTTSMLTDTMWQHANGCAKVSENISWGKYDNTSASAMNGWMGSKPHRKAILNPEYTLTGIGISGNKIVQHFCIAR